MPALRPTLLPNALKLARESKDVSQARLASAAGISPGYVAMIELGRRQPSLAVVIALAKGLGVPPSHFAVFDPDSVPDIDWASHAETPDDAVALEPSAS